MLQWCRKIDLFPSLSHFTFPLHSHYLASFLVEEGKEKERLVHTVCACATTEFCGDHVHTCMRCHKFAVFSSCAVGVLFEWVLYCAVLCLLVAGYVEIKLKKEQIASNEYHLPRKLAFMRISTIFGKSIPTMAYQIFLFVPNSIKLDRACSSDVYSVLRTKA